jgi:peptide/nickel transport system ATP-binding protein
MIPSPGVTVTGLSVDGPSGTIVQPIDFTVPPGRTLAIIGESGSGKSMTVRALTGLLPRGTSATGGATIDDERYSLESTHAAQWARVRGRKAVLLLQDPFTSLSPVLRCGEQIGATIKARMRSVTRGADPGAPGDSSTARTRRLSSQQLQDEIVARLAEVRLPADTARRFPSELSGGQRQRVAIAAALAAEPRLLIADEPTTALDASTQGEVLDLLRELQRVHNMSLILISHDLGVVAGRADEVIVMRSGAVVERGEASRVLAHPEHEYTRALLEANPSISNLAVDEPDGSDDFARAGDSTGVHSGASAAPALLVADQLSKNFGRVQALTPTTVTVHEAEIVAVVGESGSGKSTFARCVAGLERPDTGEVRLAGETLPAGRKGRTPSQMQIVFQDPYSTLNPSFTVRQALAEALSTVGRGPEHVDELLQLVDLAPEFAGRRPAQLSGGQRQRVSIARALAAEPKLLICDESVSALDVSVQAQILELLEHLRDELRIGMLFITHDLGVVARLADGVVVLQNGILVEEGPVSQVLHFPQHPYTQMLVSAARSDSIRKAES